MDHLDVERVARELLRAVRGPRSQLQFSRKLGFRGNPVARWEGGHRSPSATAFFRACGIARIDVARAVAAFHPPAAASFDPAAPAAWLSALKGDASHADLAARGGLSRQQVGRALRGDADPRLPDLLALVEAATGRVGDLVGQLVDIAAVPSLAGQLALIHRVRRLAFAEPWSPAVLSVLETLPEVPAPDELGRLLQDRLQLADDEARRLATVVCEAGALDVKARRSPLTVDVAPTAEEHQRLRAHWAAVTAERVARAEPGDVFSFNVFAVSRADLARIRELQRSFYREVRAIVASSEPEVAASLTVHTATFERGG